MRFLLVKTVSLNCFVFIVSFITSLPCYGVALPDSLKSGIHVRVGTGGVTNVAYYGEERAMYLLLGAQIPETQHEVWLGYVDLFFWTPYRDKTGFAVKTTWNIADSYSLLASAAFIKGNTQFVSLGMHYKF